MHYIDKKKLIYFIKLGRCSVGIGEDFCRVFLWMYEREHSREKPCSCHHKRFPYIGIITRRYRIHTGERLFTEGYSTLTTGSNPEC